MIGADERLSDDQKAALIAVYRSMVGHDGVLPGTADVPGRHRVMRVSCYAG